jgi:hypothetical protein
MVYGDDAAIVGSDEVNELERTIQFLTYFIIRFGPTSAP